METIRVDEELAAAQRLLLEVVYRRWPVLIAGEPVTAGEWFAALKAVAVLVRLSVPQIVQVVGGLRARHPALKSGRGRPL
jgi:hypothetical protein